jgi:hypothetical protein
MSNMPAGDNSGAEPRDHHERCRTECPWANDHSRDILDVDGDMVCPSGHWEHECSCADLDAEDAESYAQSQAEAYADRNLWGRE